MMKKVLIEIPKETLSNVQNGTMDMDDVRYALRAIKGGEVMQDERQPCGECVRFNKCWEEKDFLYIETDKDGRCPKWKKATE